MNVCLVLMSSGFSSSSMSSSTSLPFVSPRSYHSTVTDRCCGLIFDTIAEWTRPKRYEENGKNLLELKFMRSHHYCLCTELGFFICHASKSECWRLRFFWFCCATCSRCCCCFPDTHEKYFFDFFIQMLNGIAKTFFCLLFFLPVYTHDKRLRMNALIETNCLIQRNTKANRHTLGRTERVELTSSDVDGDRSAIAQREEKFFSVRRCTLALRDYNFA